MKTTLELPDDLMRTLKVHAAQNDRKLKDLVAELIERGLEAPQPANRADPLHAWLQKLVADEDGRFVNPNGIEDPAFFDELDRLRHDAQHKILRDPFAHDD